MIEIISDYLIPTGGIYAFGLFSVHIVDSVRFIATRLGILNSSQVPVVAQESDDQTAESEQSSYSGVVSEADSEMMETMHGAFANVNHCLSTISEGMADLGVRHERSDSRMLNLHKHNKSMFSRLSSRLDSNERLFEEILGPLEEIIQDIQDNSSTITQGTELETSHSGYENIPVDTEMEVIQYD